MSEETSVKTTARLKAYRDKKAEDKKMSEEKMYAVKNDKGLYWDFKNLDGFWPLTNTSRSFTVSEHKAKQMAKEHGGRVVPLIEEPKKVVLTKAQADIMKKVKVSPLPADCISANSSGDNEELLMNAYVNGYTVAKEKKYLLPMDGTLAENDDNNDFQLYAYCYKGRWLTDEAETDPSYKHQTVTQKELETAPEWIKAITPVEVTDDE